MSAADDEFFDDDVVAPPGRSGRRSRGTRGGSPLSDPKMRLLIVAAFAIILILVLITSVRGCQRDKLVQSYKSYITAANAIMVESTNQGSTLNQLLQNQAGQKQDQINVAVEDLSKKASDLLARAKDLKPPDSLQAENGTFVKVLEYRAQGLSELPKAIDTAITTTGSDSVTAAATIATPMQTLAASDVIYRISYIGPVENALQKDKIKDVQVGRSEFLAGNNIDKVTTQGAQEVISNLKRVKPTDPNATTGPDQGGKHGIGIVSVFAVNGNDRRQLTPGAAVQLANSSNWNFEVTVENGGDFVENGVEVKFTYTTPDNQTKPQTATIDQIQPGTANQVKKAFPLGMVPYLGKPSEIKVELTPVPGEQFTTNNTATYPVQFNQ